MQGLILPDFLDYTSEGLYCKYGNFYVDPMQPAERAVISHAHGDHACPGNKHVFCTAATADIMTLRLKKNAAGKFFRYAYHEPFELGAVKISFLSAGHILGSAQVLMEYQGVRYLYTGDIKLQADATCEPAEFAHADVLITETTFADPAVVHPDAAMEISKLNAFNHNVLLGAYTLGKSQRLVHLINTYCPGREVLLHHSMVPVTRIYEQYGFAPGRYLPYNRKLMKNPATGFVYIVPPLTFDCYFRAKNVLRVFASGWARLQAQNDLSLYISDHVDWRDLLQVIENVRPSEIWTLHGDGQHLQQHLRGAIDVKILNATVK